MATLSELHEVVGGKLIGDPSQRITAALPLGEAATGHITFVKDDRALRRKTHHRPTAVVAKQVYPDLNCSWILVDDVEAAFSRIVTHLCPPHTPAHTGISPQSHIAPSAQLATGVTVYAGAFVGEDVTIGPGSIIYPGVVILGQCRIGQRVTIFPNAVLYQGTIVGDRAILHAGCVLGAYGFGYNTVGGQHQLGAQFGHVEIGDDVEIGANTTIDRASYGATRVGRGTKIDNLVMVGHNCNIGRDNLLCSQVGIAGSCTTGDHVVMAGQVGIGDHLSVGDKAVLAAKSGVIQDVPGGQTYVGIPAAPIREQMMRIAVTAKLPQLRKQVLQMQQQMDKITAASPLHVAEHSIVAAEKKAA